MMTGKIFENGRSQAIRLPKEYRFDSTAKEVGINKVGDVLVIFPIDSKWAPFLECLNNSTEEFDVEEISDLDLQEREAL